MERQGKNSIILLFFLIAWGAKAQLPNDIYRHPGNEKYLEHLVKIKVDSVRATKGLKPLANDSILYVASKYHAGYLMKLGRLDHYENDIPDRKTPQLRAEYFGAVNYLVGENLVSSQFGTTIIDKKGKIRNNFTYDEIATNLVIAWVNSPGHYKNIITGDYNATGLSVVTDPDKKTVYAVQKFATILFRYDFTENHEMFSYSDFVQPPLVSSFSEVSRDRHPGKHAWKLKTPKDSVDFCYNCNSRIDSTVYLSDLKMKGNKIVFSTPDVTLVNELLKKRKNGLAIEVMEYGPYDCGNPEYYTHSSRRNNQCVFSGKVLKPLYRKELAKGFKGAGKKKSYKKVKEKISEGKVKRYEYTIGKLPKGFNGYLEFNLVIIQKKKVCRVWHFSDACGDVPEEPYPLPFITELPHYDYTPAPEKEKIVFEIPFEQGKSEYNRKDIQPILDTLIYGNFIVDSLEINAFSSLEGDETINRELQKKRAQTIAVALLEKQENKIKYSVTATENHPLFEQQVKNNPELKMFAGLSKEETRKKINDPGVAEKFEKYLAQQRKAKITMWVTITVTESSMEKHIEKKFSTLTQRYQKTKSAAEKKSITDTLLLLQFKARDLVKNKKVKPALLAKFDYKSIEDYTYRKNQVLYSADAGLYNGKDSAETEKNIYQAYASLNNNSIFDFDVQFNQLRYLVKDKKLPDQKLFATLAQNSSATARNEQENRYVQEAIVDHHVKVCRLAPDNAEASLKFLRDFYISDTLSSDSLRYEMAELFTHFRRHDYAFQVLMLNYLSGRNHRPSLILLYKLLYDHHEETHTDEYHNELVALADVLSTEEWCGMFVGPCNISFQVFDHEPFRKFYCEKCGEYRNYAKSPEKWK